MNRQGKTLTYIYHEPWKRGHSGHPGRLPCCSCVRTFKCFGIQWTTGDPYNNRVWSALNRVDPKMARQYYFTTVNY